MSAIFGIIGAYDDKIIQRMAGVLRNRTGSSEFSPLIFLEGFLGQIRSEAFSDDFLQFRNSSLHVVSDGYPRLPPGGRSESAIEETRRRLLDGDVSILASLAGSFSMAFWLVKQKTLILARDPAGSRPLYYAIKNNTLIFSSGPQSIFSSGLVSPSANPEGISHYLSMIGVPDPVTIYRDVMSLPPGHFLRFEKSCVEVKPFWSPVWSKVLGGHPDEESAAVNLRSSLEQAVIDAIPESLESTGFFLSGGTDTTTVVGLASKAGISPIHTFTIGYEGWGGGYEDFNEFPFAKLIADKYRTVHHEISISPDLVTQALPKIIAALDQPSGDAINSFLAAQSIPKGFNAVLTGTGGDEIFIGSHWYHQHQRILDFVNRWRRVPPALQKAACGISSMFPQSGIFRKILLLEELNNGVPSQYQQIKFVFKETEKQALFIPEFFKQVEKHPSSGIVDEYFKFHGSTDVTNQLAGLLIQHEVSNVQLRDLDTMCHSNGLEARSPLLDRRVLDSLASLPGDLKCKDGRLRHLMYKALKDVIPEETITRKKMSFIVPMDLWARRDLRHHIEFVLSPEVVRKRGIFQPAQVDKIKSDFFETGRERHPFKIWLLAMLELWLRFHIDSPVGSDPPDRIEDLF
jgi:asparagine synthase (glutamine-hydrolysing)